MWDIVYCITEKEKKNQKLSKGYRVGLSELTRDAEYNMRDKLVI